MQSIVRKAALLALPAILAAALAACDREDDEGDVSHQAVPMDQVPPAVKATIAAQSGNATVQSIEKVEEQGRAVYEAHFTTNGKKLELRIAEDGKVLPAESRRDDDD
jgi:uncharacterized membrane protein YkoI